MSLWQYRPPLDAVFTALKFHRLEFLGTQLGERMADHMGSRLGACEMVIPMPLHWRRYLERGYNQAELIARPLAKALRLPLSRALHRRRATPPQSRLGRARRLANMRRAFGARRRVSFRGRHVLLVDDVLTTGTTLTVASKCLLQNGARAVTTATAARAP